MKNKSSYFIKYVLYSLGINKLIVKSKVIRFDDSFYIKKDNRVLTKEKKRINSIPRYTTDFFNIENVKIKFLDSASFLFMFEEIFEKEIYKFQADSDSPIIVDCGANIGLSVLYFKKKYPKSIITAFEPDKKVFEILQENISYHHYKNITLINKALWDTETSLDFYSEGADGGRIALESDLNQIIKVDTIELKGFIQDIFIDFLKIDIEGSETVVLRDCKDSLLNVKNIFIEYHSIVNERQTLSEILSILQDAGFRYYISPIGVQSKNPFISLNSFLSMDNQLNIFGFRL